MQTDYLKNIDPDWYKQRLAWVALCVLGAFLVLTSRLFYLQIVQGGELRRLSENNCIRLQSLDAPRGLIYDRNGILLADNRPAFNLSIVPRDAHPLDRTVTSLGRLLNTPAGQLYQAVQDGGRGAYTPVLLEPDIGRDALAVVAVNQFDLPGVRVDVSPRRHYLFPRSTAHLIGYLGEIGLKELRHEAFADCRGGDTIGKYGVEKQFEAELRGRRGGRQVEVDATGRVVRVLKTVDARAGHNLYLTLDQGLQSHAQALMGERSGALVAMDPANGDVLALVSSPAFDPNAFVDGLSHDQWQALSSDPARPMHNKALQGEYPPASTYKIITALAGLEEGVIDTETTVFCPGHYDYGNRTFRCWKKWGHGRVDVVRALAESCDVFFYQVGQKLGVDRLAWYARACGLGAPTGVELDHESAGLVPTAAWKKRRTGVPWQGGETLTVAIGQGYNLVTTLQMAVLTAAVANGGMRFTPHILQRIETAAGSLVKARVPRAKGRLPVSPQTLEVLREGLFQAVNRQGGTAWGARLNAVAMSGKTGTAQVFGKKKNDEREGDEIPAHLRDHAWFVAYAPAEAPRIAVAVLIEHGEHGSTAAAPVARDLIAAYLGVAAEIQVAEKAGAE